MIWSDSSSWNDMSVYSSNAFTYRLCKSSLTGFCVVWFADQINPSSKSLTAIWNDTKFQIYFKIYDPIYILMYMAFFKKVWQEEVLMLNVHKKKEFLYKEAESQPIYAVKELECSTLIETWFYFFYINNNKDNNNNNNKLDISLWDIWW